jgi:hypothetical protein
MDINIDIRNIVMSKWSARCSAEHWKTNESNQEGKNKTKKRHERKKQIQKYEEKGKKGGRMTNAG